MLTDEVSEKIKGVMSTRALFLIMVKINPHIKLWRTLIMTKKKCLIATSIILFFGLAIVPAMVNAASCFCIYAGATYKICYEGMNDSYDVTGYRIASFEDVPIAGSANVNRDGDTIISFSQLPSWTPSSSWVHPHATTNINYSQGSYTSTYHGDSASATLNFTGSAYVITCPSTTDAELSPGPEEGIK